MCQACKPWAGYAESLRRFDLTPADYVAILQAQGGVCHIYFEPPRGQRLSIDHDHVLPEGRAAVRGLLCRDCNYSRLPRFEEDVTMLLRAISYLTSTHRLRVSHRRILWGMRSSDRPFHMRATSGRFGRVRRERTGGGIMTHARDGALTVGSG